MCYSFRYCTRYALCHVACASRCVICCVSAAITNMSHNFFSSPTPTRTFRKSPHGATRSCVVYSTYPCQVRTLGKYRVGADLACLSRRHGFAGFKRRERERGMYVSAYNYFVTLQRRSWRAPKVDTSETSYRGSGSRRRRAERTKKTNVWVKLHHIALLCGVLSSRQEDGKTESQAAVKAW
jgi:hypothetical protein